MRVDGKAIAEAIYRELAVERAQYKHAPRLGIVVSQGDAVTDSYVKIKTQAAQRLDVALVRHELSPDASTVDACAAVEALTSEGVYGIIVQLPLGKGIDSAVVLALVPAELDVDALNPGAVVLAPVAGAVKEILERSRVDATRKRAVVIGAGRLVGAPAAALLTQLGAHVTVITQGDSLDALKDADIIVSGAGRPGLITPEFLKDGVVLIDAGTSESAGKVAGDADVSCEAKASIFTPVPGGVGPIAIAMIFKNLFTLARV